MPEYNVPAHIAIILDGNGRWAKKRGLPRSMGHAEGCKAVEQTVEDCARLGVKYLTVYGFSTENWKRSSEEVSGLMKLFRHYMVRLLKTAKANNVRVRVLGERSRFEGDIIQGLCKLEDETASNTGLCFNIAVNYGGRDEMVRAVQKIAAKVADGSVKAEDISEDMISMNLDSAGIPDPDLLIRTGGEQRLSNFLLWQSAYTEFYYTDIFWPDFDMTELKKSIEWYNTRQRRFGGVVEE